MDPRRCCDRRRDGGRSWPLVAAISIGLAGWFGLVSCGGRAETESPARETPTSTLSTEEKDDMADPGAERTGVTQPAYVTSLESAFGLPSQAGFGSAAFFEPHGAAGSLSDAALAKYRFFVGDRWQRYGEAAWMGPWRQVFARSPGAGRDVVAELRAITDRDAAGSVPMVLDATEDPTRAQAALAAAFDDPAVRELEVFNIGDGQAMSGLVVAGRRAGTGETTILVFLMD